MEIKITRIIHHTDMRLQHDGLIEFAKKHARLNLETLKPGELIVFINAKYGRVKTWVAPGIISYPRAAKRFITMDMIAEIPRYMGANGEVKWDKLQRESLEKKLLKLPRAKRTPTPKEIATAKTGGNSGQREAQL